MNKINYLSFIAKIIMDEYYSMKHYRQIPETYITLCFYNFISTHM